MDSDQIKDIKMPEIDFNKLKLPIISGILILMAYFCFYQVEANEEAVILRLGKYSDTVGPGLHFKIPFVDRVYKIKVDYQYKEEFGFRTNNPGVRTSYSQRGYENESWMLTGDLKIAEVHWVVQYKISEPEKYLFKVKNVENTIRDVSEATMRLMIGDRSFKEVLQKERTAIANLSKDHMQDVLDSYETGIQIQMVQLQGVVPPAPVADSFNEVNRAKQEEETLVNEANQEYNKKIFTAKGIAQKMINEAEGYYQERTNEADGDAALFEAVFENYKNHKDITRTRLFLEKMETVLSDVSDKIVIDTKIEGVLPFLNVDKNGDQEK
ncbi:MAG: FtsH protease activity modulator HflK [Candidatus Marinimicrobia bacterium]|nr:FtsH protease activity modulator HflK [Candidatus Neomarinimicrobiota bacterium]